MKSLLANIFFLSLMNCASAQKSIVNILFEVDGKPIAYKHATVKFIKNGDTLIESVANSILEIPESVLHQRLKAVFIIDKYILTFDSIPITINKLSPKWTLGVDNKPFNKKKLWMIKEWKSVQIVYYLNNDDGRILTVDYRKEKDVKKMRAKTVKATPKESGF